jgi:two-component system sensor histidine kinase HydH
MMNLLKQTALILGLVSISLCGWTLYRNWRQKTAVLFAAVCFVLSWWALTFVSHVTLSGRTAGDIHFLLNLWLSPIGVLLLSQMLPAPNRVSQWLLGCSSLGAAFLSVLIMSSHTDFPFYRDMVVFWPTFIFGEFLYLFWQDIILKKPVRVDFIPSDRRNWLYAGLGLCLLTCTLDHLPYLGFIIPSIGNLLLTTYLVFIAQVITPQKLLRLDALFSRFLAIVTLSLIITGFFALVYQYISETFPLFLLNSFLISFAVLVLWTPLVSLFRFLGSILFKKSSLDWNLRFQSFQLQLIEITDISSLEELLQTIFSSWLQANETHLVLESQFRRLPEAVETFFLRGDSANIPILHRELIHMERHQLFTQGKKEELDSLLHFLDFWKCDIVFPVYSGPALVALIKVAAPGVVVEWTVTPAIYNRILITVQGVGEVIHRITQIEAQTEKERLILLGEMAAGLAHEVRNPLGAIRGAAELIDSASSPWGKVIQEEVGRLNRLVSQFLEFAHVPKEIPDRVNLNELVSTCVNNFSASAGIPQGSSVDCELYPQPVWVYVVPDQIQQVILNLMQNALKAMEQKDTKIENNRVKVQVFKAGFAVADHGIGMSESLQKKVFQPFFTSFAKGTGLGLSICQHLIQLNYGDIKIESKENEGTRMIVSLREQEWKSCSTAS